VNDGSGLPPKDYNFSSNYGKMDEFSNQSFPSSTSEAAVYNRNMIEGSSQMTQSFPIEKSFLLNMANEAENPSRHQNFSEHNFNRFYSGQGRSVGQNVHSRDDRNDFKSALLLPKEEMMLSNGSNSSFGNILLSNTNHLTTDPINNSNFMGESLDKTNMMMVTNSSGMVVPSMLGREWKCSEDGIDTFVDPSDPVLLKPKRREHLQTNSSNAELKFSNHTHNSNGAKNKNKNSQLKINSNRDIEMKDDEPITPGTGKSGKGIFKSLIEIASSGMRKKEGMHENGEQVNKPSSRILPNLGWKSDRLLRKRSNSKASMGADSMNLNTSYNLKDERENSVVPSLSVSNPFMKRANSNPTYLSEVHLQPYQKANSISTSEFQKLSIMDNNNPHSTLDNSCLSSSIFPSSNGNNESNIPREKSHSAWSELSKLIPRLDRTSNGIFINNFKIGDGVNLNKQHQNMADMNSVPYQVPLNRASSFQRFVQPKRSRTDLGRSSSTQNVSWATARGGGGSQENQSNQPQVSSARRGAAARRPRFKGRFMRTSNVWTSITELQRPKRAQAQQNQQPLTQPPASTTKA